MYSQKNSLAFLNDFHSNPNTLHTRELKNTTNRLESSFNARLLSNGVACNHHQANIQLRVFLPREVSSAQMTNFFRLKNLQNNKIRPAKEDLPQKISSSPLLFQKEISKRDSILQIIKMNMPPNTLKFQEVEERVEEEVGPELLQTETQLSLEAKSYYIQICRDFDSNSSLCSFCESSKELNLAFQRFIQEANPQELALIRNKAIAEFEQLVLHKHGNYLIQRIIKKDKVFANFVVETCVANFERLSNNEFSSRVMQLLVAVRADFRAFVHSFFKEHIHYACSKLTVTFQLMIAIRHSSKPADFAYVHQAMIQDHSLIGVALFKRVLISYFQFADEKMANETWGYMKKICSFESFFDKKFNSLLLLMILRRGFGQILSDIFMQFSKKVADLIDRRCFKLVAEKLLQHKYENCKRQLKDALTSASLSDLASLIKKAPTNFKYYLYLTVASFDSTEVKDLQRFIAKMGQNFGKKVPLLEILTLENL